MNGPPLFITRLTGTAGRIGDIAAQVLEDRLTLLALEMREAKIRLLQAWLLACIGVIFSLLGLLLLALAGVYALPVEWRLYGLVGTAIAGMLAGVAAFIALNRHLGQRPLAFDQSIAELRKDITCFSTRN